LVRVCLLVEEVREVEMEGVMAWIVRQEEGDGELPTQRWRGEERKTSERLAITTGIRPCLVH
jgi:hypothetical protein